MANGGPVTAPTSNTQAGVHKLRGAGMEEQAAESVVEVGEATSPLVTHDALKVTRDMRSRRNWPVSSRGFGRICTGALWMQGVAIVAVMGGIVAILEAID